MSVMLYRQGKGTRFWGKEYKTVIVRDDEVSEHLNQGWHKHPDEVKAEKPEQESIKRTRKTKAESDESDD